MRNKGVLVVFGLAAIALGMLHLLQLGISVTDNVRQTAQISDVTVANTEPTVTGLVEQIRRLTARIAELRTQFGGTNNFHSSTINTPPASPRSQTQSVPSPTGATPFYLGESMDACTTEAGADIAVTQFGAIPDDGKDDTKAINAAFDCVLQNTASQAYQGGRLHFPAGRYILSRSLSATGLKNSDLYGFHLSGAGSHRTTIEFSGANGVINFDLETPRFFIKISSITLSSDRPRAGSAIRVYGADRGIQPQPSLVVRDVEINGTAPGNYFTNGIDNFGSKRSYVMNTSIAGGGVKDMQHCYQFEEVYGPTVQESSCRGAEVGINYFSDKLAGYKSPEGGHFIDNTISDVDTGIYVKTYGVEPALYVAGNTFSTYSRGMTVDGRRFVDINNNSFSPAGAATGYIDLDFSGVELSQVDHNTFAGTRSRDTSHIYLDNLVAPTRKGYWITRESDHNMFFFNDILGNVSIIRERGGANENTVYGNE